MKLAMISCAAYQDAWKPFIDLVDHFWPDHPPVTLVSDAPCLNQPGYERSFFIASKSWCEIAREFARDCYDEPVLMFLDDFFLSAPVHPDLIERGLEQMKATGAGCVRLYPCPGGMENYGDEHFAIVPRGTNYRISTMPALWNPVYLRAIASRCNTPWEFELKGTGYSNERPEPVLAWKRDVEPWPVEILASAISRGQWNPDAKKLCDSLGIEGDWTMRPFQAA